MKNLRRPFYVLVVIIAMVAAYFITEFILKQLDIAVYSTIWYVSEICVCLLFGALFALAAPSIVNAFMWMVKDFSFRISRYSTKELVSGTIGLIVGLVIAFLISIPMETLPFGPVLSIVIIIFFGYAGLLVGLHKKEDVGAFLDVRRGVEKKPKGKKNYLGVLDTSAIIDGRIADVYRTGFLDGSFILPQFVLDELKRVADSKDPLKKARGRRGLNILNDLQEEYGNAYVVINKDYDDVPEVDTKIVRLAADMKTRIFTNDYNLNRMAQVQNIKVLNVNDLSYALKGVVLPGEELTAHIVKDGKEEDQGVAFMDDGTMIVVEDGKKYMGLTLNVTVTSALQTQNGKMIFAKPSK